MSALPVALSLVTNASAPPANARWKAPLVVGKFEDDVHPVIVALPEESTTSPRRRVPAVAAQISGINQCAAGGIELADKAIPAAACVGRLESAAADRKIGRIGISGEVGVTGRVYNNSVIAPSSPAPTQVGRVDQAAAGGIKLGDKNIAEAASIGSLEGSTGSGEVRGIRPPGNIGLAGGVYCNAPASVICAAP